MISRYNKKKREFRNKEQKILQTIKSTAYLNVSINVKHFDDNKNIIGLSICDLEKNKNYCMHLSKNGTAFSLLDIEFDIQHRFFLIFNSLLSDLYDLYKDNKSFRQDEFVTLIKEDNTYLYFGLDHYGWSIEISEPYQRITSELLEANIVSFPRFPKDELEFLRENIENVFDNLYIETSRLPRYLQEESQKGLEEEPRLQEAQNVTEEKMSKKEERKVKFKSFINRFKKAD